MFFVMMTSIMSALGLYVGARLVWPLPFPVWVRLLLCLVVLLAVNKMTLMYWFMPGSQLQLSNTVLLLISWLHVSVIVIAFLTLTVDVVWLFLRLMWVPPLPPLFRTVIIGLIGGLLAGWGIHNAIKPPQVVEMDVPVRNLPEELEGYRIGLLADIHLGPLFGKDWARTVTDLTNEAKPDVIVIAGDVVDGTLEQLADMIVPLHDLDAPDGVYAIVGNHEYYSGLESWRHELPTLGLRLLYNEHAVIEKGDAKLVFAGLTDRVAMRGGGGERPDLAKALSGDPYDDKAVRVVLEHQPAWAKDNAVHGMQLQLSGHTHGGLALPLQPLVSRFNGGFVSGLYDVDGMSLVVTNGAGLWAGLPLRLGVPSQIPMLRLVRKG